MTSSSKFNYQVASLCQHCAQARLQSARTDYQTTATNYFITSKMRATDSREQFEHQQIGVEIVLRTTKYRTTLQVELLIQRHLQSISVAKHSWLTHSSPKLLLMWLSWSCWLQCTYIRCTPSVCKLHFGRDDIQLASSQAPLSFLLLAV